MKNKESLPKNPHFPFAPLIAVVLLALGILGCTSLAPLLFPKPGSDRPLNSIQNVNPYPTVPLAAQPSSQPQPEAAVAASAIPTPAESETVPTSPVPVESPQPPKKPSPIRVPILLYHYVRDVVHSRDIARYEMNATPAIFEDQLKTLIGDGYHFVTLAQVLAALESSTPLPEKPIVLTFDDGLVDVYTTVFPLLKKYQVPITAYLVPALLDHKQYLTSTMAKELAHSGWVEIGSHTTHHLKLTTLLDQKATAEIAESKATLEKLLGVTITSFAYPFGLYSANDPKIVQDAGYSNAVSMIWTVVRDSADPYLLPRLNIGEKSGKTLLDFLKGFK